MQSPYCHSQSGKALSGNLNAKDLEEGSISYTQDKLRRCAVVADNVSGLKSTADFPAYIFEDRKDSLNGGSSEVPVKNLLKSASKTGKSGTKPSDDASECLNRTIRIKKLNESESFDIHSGSGDENDESDIVLHDVKVCDICGDAGREDLLAICSRCSDGAEHTYCMQQMLDKVPAGNWLCEECKFAGETEMRMQSKHEMVDRTEKNGFSECPNSVNGVLSKGSDVEVKLSSNLALDISRTDKRNQSSQVIRKSHSDNIEAAALARSQDLEKTAGSRKASSPNRTGTLPCDWPFKSLDKGKVKPSYQVSSVPQSIKKVAETAGRRFQTPRGTLLKSNSFNTSFLQPKVKHFDEPILLRQKGPMSPVKALDMKGGPSRSMGKSMSFKSTNFSRADATDVKTKLLPLRVSHVQEYKGLKLKQTKERTSISQFDNPVISSSSSALSGLNGDQKSKSRGEASFKNRDFNAFRSDGNSNSLLNPVSNLTREGSEILVRASTRGISKSAEQKPSQVSPRDESLSSSFTAEGIDNVFSTFPDGFPELRESSNQADKTRDNFCTSSRQGITSRGKVFCQESKEIGHVSKILSVGDSRASVVDVSCTRTSRELIEKGSRLKAAIEAAMMRKPQICRLNKLSILSDDFSVSSRELKCDTVSQDQSSVPCHQRNTISSEGIVGGQAIFQSRVSESHKQPKVTEIKLSYNTGDSDSNILFDGKIMGDLHKHAPVSVLVPSKISAIPEHEYIWQGGFEVHGTGKFADLCCGVQAHLSTCASPKVLEVVHKFPEKVSLNEVARLSTWPTDFLDRGANDDNIALYFFAKDFESYERNYKCLLDHMMKNDLALKGKIDDIELLIFPSIHLPEKSQRWNMLFFLWGVFRGKRTSCLDDILGSLKKLPMAGSSAAHQCIPAAVISMPETSLKDRDSSPSEQSCSVGLESNSLTEVILPVEKFHRNCDTESMIDQMHLKLIPNLEQQDDDPVLNSASRIPTDNVLVGSEMRCTTNSWKDQTDPDCRLERHHQPSHRLADTVTTSEDITVNSVRGEGKFERNTMEEELVQTEAAVERCTSAATLDLKDLNVFQLRKRLCQVSSGSGHAIEQLSKKLNTGSEEMYNSYGYSNTNSLPDHFTSSRGANYHLSENNSPGTLDLIDNPENSVTSERRFFPTIDLGSVDDYESVDKSVVPWKVLPVADEDQHLELELALGAEKKPEKQERLPFYLGLVDKNNHGNKPADSMEVEEDGEDVSASLSLSLSFPFSDKDRAVKPISKSEQLLPERHHVNTSLLLFGGYHKV